MAKCCGHKLFIDAKRDIQFGKYLKAECKLKTLLNFDKKQLKYLQKDYKHWACVNYLFGLIYSQLYSDTTTSKQYFAIAFETKDSKTGNDIIKYKMGLDAMKINKLKIVSPFCWSSHGQELANLYSELIDVDEYLARGFNPIFPKLPPKGYDETNLENNSGESDPHLTLQNNTFISNSFDLKTLFVKIGNLRNAVYNDGEWLLMIKFDDTEGDALKIAVQFHTKIIHPHIDKQGFITESTFSDFIKRNPTLHEIIARVKSLLNDNIDSLIRGKSERLEIKKHIKEIANHDKIEQNIINNMNLISIFLVRRQLYTFTTAYQSNHYNPSKIKLIIKKILKQLFDIDDEKLFDIVCSYLYINHDVTQRLSILKKRHCSIEYFKKLFGQLTGRHWHQNRNFKYRYE